MCGIAVFFSRDKAIERDAIERATAALDHRGPDSRHCWLSADGRVGLGHARLSIIDLRTGDQPIKSEDERLSIVVNGEFYDFERISRELEQRGHKFRTRSDSEVALHLYEDLGAHCLRQLRGEFALALWDASNQTLFAARDRFGIKPLFYAHHDNTLILASEVKALFAAGVPARWDHESFYQGATGVPISDRTLFEGVHQVPPGHYLLASRDSFRIMPYWDFNYSSAAEISSGPDDDRGFIERFHDVLDEAVRLRMRADVPVGCYLSGGLDSCALLGLASRHAIGPVRAFTLTFDQAAYDESAIAQEMAAHVGATYQPIPITQADLADHFSDAIWHAETLFINGHGVSKYLLSRAVRDAGFKVVFTGEGSDETLGGYAHFRHDMVLSGAQSQDAAEVERHLKAIAASNSVSRGLLLPEGETQPLDSVRRLLGFVPTMFEIGASMAAKRLPLLDATFKARFAGHDGFRVFLNQIDVLGQVGGRDPLNQALYLWSKSVLPTYLLTVLGDRMEMAHSVEGRVPFLDHHVVEFLRRVPVSLKIRGMTEKYLLREAVRPVLTDTVYRRPKHPFLAPPVTLTPTEPFHQLLQDTLRGPGLDDLPFYDRKKVVTLLDRLPVMDDAERTAWDPILTSILSACVLQERLHLGQGALNPLS